MQKIPSSIVSGLYLSHWLLRIQLNEVQSEMNAPELEDFTRSLGSGELSETAEKALHRALSQAIELLTEQHGMLQATQLTRGLFKPAVIRVITEHLLFHTYAVDWDEVGQVMPRIAEEYGIAELINRGLRSPLRPQDGDRIRLDMEKACGLLQLAWHGEIFSSDADHTYMQIWSRFFPDSRTLCENLYKIGVRSFDDGESSTAVANLLGTKSGEFEAFCILHSLGPELANAWEKEQVVFGNSAYDGAVTRARQCFESTERDAYFASAVAAGYPVRDTAVETDEFSDLIIQIPGYAHADEHWLLTNLIQSIAPLLYQALSEGRLYKSRKWRGVTLSSDYEQTQLLIEDSIGVAGWMPAVRLRVEAFMRPRTSRAGSGQAELDSQFALARKRTTLGGSSLRVIYLIDSLCDIIEHDFYAHDFFK